jgi:hypothetical protein
MAKQVNHQHKEASMESITTTAAYSPENVRRGMETNVYPLESQAKALLIKDQTTYDEACYIAKSAVEARRKIVEGFKPGKRAAHTAHREIVKMEAALLERVSGAERIVKQKISGFQEERERQRVDRQMQMERQARGQKETEVKRIIETMIAEGVTDEEEIRVAGQTVALEAVYAALDYKADEAVVSRETWSGHITDFMKFVNFVADNPHFMHLLKPDMTAVNQLVRSQKELCDLPGLSVKKTNNIAIRTA